jgi:hypothetical protein
MFSVQWRRFFCLLKNNIIFNESLIMQVDLIIKNARIYTVNENFDIENALVVDEGKIVAVGSWGDLCHDYELKKNGRFIDLGGKAVYPGFYDAHCHFFGYAQSLRDVDLKSAESMQDVIDILRSEVDQNLNSCDQWLLGRGWDENNWVDTSRPTNELLNRAFPNIAVFLKRVDGHAALVNQKALEICDVDVSTQIKGGELIRNNSALTGLLIDNATKLVSKNIPPIPETRMKELIKQAQLNCFKVGLTSLNEAGIDYDRLELLQDMSNSNDLKINLYILPLGKEGNRRLIEAGAFWRDNLHFRGIKMLADGAIGSRGALLLSPYSDAPGEKGFLLHDEEYFEKWCRVSYKNNLQVCIHAIGDGANRFVLNLYKKFLQPGNNRRWRVEHAQIIDREDLNTYGEYDIIPSVQTTHCTTDMFWAKKRLGKIRLRNSYIYQDLLNQNGWIINGSDFPVESINPLYGFYAGVVRKNLDGNPRRGFQMENSLTRRQALQAMTIWAARGCFEEKEKGSLEPGKRADFVILDKDIMKCREQDIPGTKVEETFINGESVLD